MADDHEKGDPQMQDQAPERRNPPVGVGRGLRRWFLQPPRRHGEVIEGRTVSFLELFYDLVFVVLIGQAALTLAGDVSWGGVGDFAVVFALIWIAWLNGTEYHELHGGDDGRSRALMFVQMLLLAVLGVYVAHATGGDGRAFAVVYALLLLVLTWQWFTVHRRDTARYRSTTSAYLAVMAASVLVMAVSAVLPDHVRVVVWAVFVVAWVSGGAVLSVLAPAGSLGVTVTDSMVERFGLFVIIVLGEVVVGVVDGISAAPRDLVTIVTGVLGLVLGFGIWWNYFDLVGRRLPRQQGGPLAVWLNGHLPTTMAVAAAGAAMISLVAHAGDARAPVGSSWLLAGSVALVLVSLVVTIGTLEDARRIPEVYRPLSPVMGGAAVVAVLIGWARPAPWLLVLALAVLLAATWVFAVARWVRVGKPTGTTER